MGSIWSSLTNAGNAQRAAHRHINMIYYTIKHRLQSILSKKKISLIVDCSKCFFHFHSHYNYVSAYLLLQFYLPWLNWNLKIESILLTITHSYETPIAGVTKIFAWISLNNNQSAKFVSHRWLHVHCLFDIIRKS